MDGVRHLVVMVRMRASAVVPRWCSVWQVQACHGILYNRRLLLQYKIQKVMNLIYDIITT